MDTIYALSSGQAPSGVAVIRVSGPHARDVVAALCRHVPQPRSARLATIRSRNGEEIDMGLVLWFPGPASFTGEDSAEFHVHGGRAVIAALLNELGGFARCRLAEPGEFSRRAFENGKLDLTEIEGLADLVRAETETQRRLALAQASGRLRQRLDAWRERIVRLRALVEADFDFADEEGVPDDVASGVWRDAGALAQEIRSALADGGAGERVRDGVRIAVLGPPNAGKSSLVNALAGRDVAIVSPEAGTTRDVIEVHLDLAGVAATVSDTAGLREAAGTVEREGIRRAREAARQADILLWLWPADEVTAAPTGELLGDERLVVVRSRDDGGAFPDSGLSLMREGSLDRLVSRLAGTAAGLVRGGEQALVSRARHRSALENCAGLLEIASGGVDDPSEIRAEQLRLAADWIGRLTGRVDIEDVLDVIFRDFCIGK